MAPGDQILVDRVAAEAGSELTLDRVLLFADGDDLKIGTPAVEGVTALARVIRHTRGQKIDVLRYKSKKRVRVHRGARADLSALEILEIGGKGRIADKPAKTAKPRTRKPPEVAVAPAPVASEQAVSAKPEPKPATPKAAAKRKPAARKEKDTDGT